MTTLKNKLKGFTPMVLGIYILGQGGALMMNEDPLVQMLGVGVLLWLPGCVYYTWRGFKPAPARETIVRPVPQQMTTKQAA